MTCSACDRGWLIWRQSNMARAICLENARLIKAPPKPKARAQTNELRSTAPCRSIPNMGRTILISNGTVSESVTIIRMLAANSRNMPFIHFIEILLHNHVLAPLFGRVTSESDYTNRFGELHLHRDCVDDVLNEITPLMPRSRRLKCLNLLGKVDPFPSFLLELAHRWGTYAIDPHVGD